MRSRAPPLEQSLCSEKDQAEPKTEINRTGLLKSDSETLPHYYVLSSAWTAAVRVKGEITNPLQEREDQVCDLDVGIISFNLSRNVLSIK